MRILRVMLMVLLAAGAALAAEMTASMKEENLDLAGCALYVDGKVQEAPTLELLRPALGWTPNAPRVEGKRTWWDTGAIGGRDRHFRVTFKAPITIGTLVCNYTGPITRPLQPMSGQWVSYLKADAAYPGDVAKDDQWITLPVGQVKTLPPGGITTRALRFSDRRLGDVTTEHNSMMARVTAFQERYYSALNIGGIKRAGRLKETETWMGAWQETQTLSGIVFFSLRINATLDVLKTAATRPALVAGNDDWKRLPTVSGGEFVIYRIEKPVATRGIRLVGGEYRTSDSNYPNVIPLVNLGDNPNVPSLADVPPPYKVKYDMPMDGFAAMEIHDKQGALVRRVVGEVARPKGPVLENWDLKDEAGNLVPPGEYTVKTIARPPLKLTWQTSVYNAGQPAWWAPPPGKGGGSWLADHTPPDSAEAMGDTVWLGAQVTESGNAFIAVDKDGNKLWGEHAVSEGFSGPERIATDGRYGYLVNNSVVQRIDPKNKFAAKFVYNFHHTLTLPGNGGHWDAFHGGAVARGDKLYISYWSNANSWLKPSFKSETIDTQASVPMVYLKKGGGRHDLRHHKPYGEGEYDEMQKMWAAFLTENSPDGASIPSSTQAVYGDAPEHGALAGWVTVAFKTPVAVGSIVLPNINIKVQALKQGMDLPANEPDNGGPDVLAGGEEEEEGGIGDEANWVSLPATGKAGRPGLALAPAGGITTKAIRFRTNRLTYALVMARRFADIAGDAERVFTEGAMTAKEGWKTTRPATTPISEFNPALMALVWPKAVPMRGISLHMPTGAYMYVDRWIGGDAENPKTALDDDSKWENAGTIRPIASWWSSQIATLASVDFGDIVNVRAVRIRAIAPEGGFYDGIYGPGFNIVDGPHIAGFDAVLAWSYLGGDPDSLPIILNERVSEYQLPDEDGNGMKELRQFRVRRPGNLVFDKNGVLHAVSDGQIVTVPLDGGAPKVVITRDKLVKPADLAFDAAGQLYVTDCGPKVIKVFNVKTGALVRTIGKEGGQKLGAWDPLRFDYPSGLTIDGNDKIWLCDHTYQPKRVQRMATDGTVEKIFLGPTQYGGGGVMDPKNRSVVNYNGMKFVIDWNTYDWKLDSILFRPGETRSTDAGMPDRVFYRNGKRYLADVGYGGNPVAAICREENGIAIPLAAMGNLGQWSDVGTRPDLRKAFGALQTKKYSFVWWDKSGDGAPQADEVQTLLGGPTGNPRSNVTVGEDLAFIAPGFALRPTGFQPDGRPMYDLAKVQSVPPQTHGPHTSSPGERVWGTEDGRTFVIGNRLIDKDGKTQLWEYFDRFAEHEGFYHSGFGYNRPPGVLNQEHSPIGHFYLPTKQGNKEEFFVTNSDQGDLFAFSGDGMLVACIFGGPAGYGLNRWTMPHWEHNKTVLDDVRLSQEHYQGWVGTADDGNVYAIAGHNHASVVRVDGLEQTTRLPLATVTVTAKDIADAQGWDIQRLTREKLRQEPKVAKMPYLEKPVEVNGSLDDWPEDLMVTVYDEVKRGFGVPDEIVVHYTGAMAYDDKHLYVASWADARDRNRVRNTAVEPSLLFKGGDAVDVTLGMDGAADPKRTYPAAGDLRILISRVKNEPVVVLYRPVVPGTPAEKAKKFTSPVGQTTIDVVKVLTDAQVEFGDGTVEAAIPWAALGVTPPKVDTIIRGDLGVLVADNNGQSTAARYYWSGKAQTVVCDVPSEARLAPSLWGTFYCTEPDKTMKFGPGDVDLD
jgi:sugar lactone lactonase YvrE